MKRSLKEWKERNSTFLRLRAKAFGACGAAGGDAAARGEVPEIERRGASEGRRTAAKPFHFGLRERPSVEALESPANAEVAETQHVVAPEGEERDHLGRPPSDAVEGDELFDDFFVFEAVKKARVELPVRKALRGPADPLRLVGGETLGAQKLKVQGKKVFGRKRPAVLAKPSHDGGGRLDADLLARKGAHQPFEEIRNNGARKRSRFLYESRPVRAETDEMRPRFVRSDEDRLRTKRVGVPLFHGEEPALHVASEPIVSDALCRDDAVAGKNEEKPVFGADASHGPRGAFVSDKAGHFGVGSRFAAGNGAHRFEDFARKGRFGKKEGKGVDVRGAAREVGAKRLFRREQEVRRRTAEGLPFGETVDGFERRERSLVLFETEGT